MKKLSEILNNSPFLFEIIQHEKPIRSREDGKEFFGIEFGQTAPTLVLKSDQDEYFALIISGKRDRIEFDKIAELLGCSKVKLASPKDVKTVTGFEVGSVRMVGLDLPCIIDKELFNYDYIYGGTGELNYTLKIEPKALEKLNRVIANYN